jgi:hypothetical protein
MLTKARLKSIDKDEIAAEVDIKLSMQQKAVDIVLGQEQSE